MTSPADALLEAFELHDPAAVAAALDAGADASAPLRGRPPLDWLLSMYTRSPRFPACLRALLARGAPAPEPALLAVLLDDGDATAVAVRAAPRIATDTFTVPCAFTALVGASLLHVAAEFGHLTAVRALLAAGADPNARAAVDADGCGAQTPLFHAVNTYDARGDAVVDALLAAGALTDVLVPALVWGPGQDWETTWFDVTPIGYATCGLSRQMHRDERVIATRVEAMLRAARRPVPPWRNLPNRYLQPRRD